MEAILYAAITGLVVAGLCYIFWKRGGPKPFFEEIEDRLNSLMSSGTDAVKAKAEELKRRLEEAGDNADQVLKEVRDWLKSLG